MEGECECFLCGGEPTSANPVNRGLLTNLRTFWLQCRSFYMSVYDQLRYGNSPGGWRPRHLRVCWVQGLQWHVVQGAPLAPLALAPLVLPWA